MSGYISNLTLALSAFTGREVVASSISKDNPKFYHVYYKHDGKNRVMLVPKEQCDIEQLQYEVEVLLSRSLPEQQALGISDR